MGWAVVGGDEPTIQRARRGDGRRASRPAARHESHVARLATGRVGLLLRRGSRARRGARRRGGALERDLRAPYRVGRARSPHVRRRPAEGVLVLGRGQRVRPFRGAHGVGLRARERRLPAAPRGRRPHPGGAGDALDQPCPGHRRPAAHPDRPRCPAWPLLRGVAGRPDRVANDHPRGDGHAPDGDRHRWPPLRRVLGRGIAPRAHPRRGRRLPARSPAARRRLGRPRRRRRRLQRPPWRLGPRRGLARLHLMARAAIRLSLRLRRRSPGAVPRARRGAGPCRLPGRPGLVRVAPTARVCP